MAFRIYHHGAVYLQSFFLFSLSIYVYYTFVIIFNDRYTWIKFTDIQGQSNRIGLQDPEHLPDILVLNPLAHSFFIHPMSKLDNFPDLSRIISRVENPYCVKWHQSSYQNHGKYTERSMPLQSSHLHRSRRPR